MQEYRQLRGENPFHGPFLGQGRPDFRTQDARTSETEAVEVVGSVCPLGAEEGSQPPALASRPCAPRRLRGPR
jgi:hypothetical protein